MASFQCISCNSPILETANLCKCGHVNEAMRTIAGKRFSGYREELYTRRVIKESRDEYLKMRRESRGIKRRSRRPLQNRQALQHETGLNNASKHDEVIDVKLAKGLKLAPDTLASHYPENDLSNDHARENNTAECKLMPKNTENCLTHDFVGTTKRRHHHTGRRGASEHRVPIPTTPLCQFSMEGPLAEINKRLINQRTFWMCLV